MLYNSLHGKAIGQYLLTGAYSMITKDEALNNLARAYFQDKVEWKIWMHAAHSDLDQRSRYQRANEKYETMRSAYLDCGVIEWADVESAWWFGVKLELPIS